MCFWHTHGLTPEEQAKKDKIIKDQQNIINKAIYGDNPENYPPYIRP